MKNYKRIEEEFAKEFPYNPETWSTKVLWESFRDVFIRGAECQDKLFEGNDEVK